MGKPCQINLLKSEKAIMLSRKLYNVLTDVVRNIQANSLKKSFHANKNLKLKFRRIISENSVVVNIGLTKLFKNFW